ncbi:MAG: ABC transporter substrate-binding protein [Chloroflexi bacterium]|nr:ABC transporter substrate-binding protein [Chloroflexota bacterium]
MRFPGRLPAMLGIGVLVILATLGCRAAAPAPTPAPAAKPAAPAAVAPSPTPRPAVAAPSPVVTAATPTPRPAEAPTAAPRVIPQKIRYIPWAMPVNRNPIDNDSYQSDMGLVSDTVLHLTFDGEVKPAVATKWESISPTVWRLKVRDDLKFSDGTPLTAEDVAFSANTMKEQKLVPYNRLLRTLDKAVVVDSTTVDLYTTTQDVILPEKLYYMMVVPKGYYSRLGRDEFSNAPIGSGPWRWVSWTSGVGWKVERNSSKHPFRNAYAESIDAQIVQEPATVSAAILAGNIDIAQTRMDPTQLDDLKKAGKKVEAWPARLFFYYFDPGRACQKGWPTCNPKVRRAMIEAVDSATYSKTLWKGLAVPVSVPAMPGGLGYRPDIPLPYNPQHAAQLLDEAGFKPDAKGVRFELRMWAWAAGTPNDQSLAMQADLAKVGVKANYQLMEFGTYVSYLGLRDGREHVELMQLLGSDTFSNNYSNLTQWCSPDPKSTSNYYPNEQVWKLNEEFLRTVDRAQRDKILGKIFEIMSIDDPCYLYVNGVPETWVLQPSLEGFRPAGGRVYFVWDDIRRTR